MYHDFSALIGSRICHDLISPIGAITNGLELMELSGDVQTPEMALISDSVSHAGARLRFFRVAFGAPGAEAMATSEVATILRDLENGGRIRFDWAVAQDQPRAEIRLAFLSLLCVETALAYGGTIRLSVLSGRWSIEGHADRLSIDEAVWQALSTGGLPDKITPALVQFALLSQALAEHGRTPELDISETRLRLRF